MDIRKITYELLEVELSDIYENSESIEKFRKYDYINRLHWSDWYAVSEDLNDDELVKLIKVLTLIEKHFKWLGGSVSSVIWVFKSLEKRHYPLIESVASFVIDNTLNPYAPYGTTR